MTTGRLMLVDVGALELGPLVESTTVALAAIGDATGADLAEEGTAAAVLDALEPLVADAVHAGAVQAVTQLRRHGLNIGVREVRTPAHRGEGRV